MVWFGLLRIYVALAVFQPYRDLEAGDNQSLKIQVARRGIEPRTSCSASQELNHSATAAPNKLQRLQLKNDFPTTENLLLEEVSQPNNIFKRLGYSVISHTRCAMKMDLCCRLRSVISDCSTMYTFYLYLEIKLI